MRNVKGNSALYLLVEPEVCSHIFVKIILCKIYEFFNVSSFYWEEL